MRARLRTEGSYLQPMPRPSLHADLPMCICCREGEHTLSLLHYVNSQSVAAAQATAVSCGAYHTAALLVPAELADDTSANTSRDCKHSLYTFGRGFHGQLGVGNHENSSVPRLASLGFRVCTVSLSPARCALCAHLVQDGLRRWLSVC